MFKKKQIKCTNCGYKGPGEKITPGSTAIELLLYLFFFLPGLIYSCWRVSKRYYGCPKCKNPFVVIR